MNRLESPQFRLRVLTSDFQTARTGAERRLERDEPILSLIPSYYLGTTMGEALGIKTADWINGKIFYWLNRNELVSETGIITLAMALTQENFFQNTRKDLGHAGPIEIGFELAETLEQERLPEYRNYGVQILLGNTRILERWTSTAGHTLYVVAADDQSRSIIEKQEWFWQEKLVVLRNRCALIGDHYTRHETNRKMKAQLLIAPNTTPQFAVIDQSTGSNGKWVTNKYRYHVITA